MADIESKGETSAEMLEIPAAALAAPCASCGPAFRRQHEQYCLDLDGVLEERDAERLAKGQMERQRDAARVERDEVRADLTARIERLESEIEALDLSRAKLLVKLGVRDGRRLSDGVEVKVGQRVVLVPETCERHGLGHAVDDLVHEITSTLGGDTGLVECGPRQIYTGHLRLAPTGSEVSCPHCVGRRAQIERMRQDAEAYRSLQVDAVFEAARRHIPAGAHDAFDLDWHALFNQKLGRSS